MPSLKLHPVSSAVLVAFLCSVPCSLAAHAAPPSASGDYPFAKAPDGHRGFGTSPDLRELEKLFRKAEGDDADFLASILDLQQDVHLLLHLTRTYYARRGYFDLLQPGEDEETLAVHFGILRRNPFAEPMGKRRAQAFVELLVDERFWVREEVMQDWREEMRQVRGGLALFRAHTHGVAELTGDGELARVTQRVDLAAARLRALRLDLEALYQSPIDAGDSELEYEEERLVELITDGDPKARSMIQDLERRSRHDRQRLRDGLFTRKLAAQLGREIVQREKGILRARGIYAEVLQLLPTFDRHNPPPPAIASMEKSERYKRSASSGVEGLFHDPFHAELNYLVGLGYDFFAGRHVSRAYFDRFLALRGIRYYDYATYGRRDLDGMEEYALLVVADWKPPQRDE
ncbi:MAG: hypothetical protein GY711_18710 [bacterium]|nr:hypothetical protein [bacterium]